MATTKKKALGKGLQALLSTPMMTTKNDQPYTATQVIAIKYIQTNPFQPRKYFDPVALQELAVSIKTYGIIQPITVKKINDTQFQLIAGERRLQAVQQLQWMTIPAYICEADEKQMRAMAIIENIQRENLNPIEIALSYQQLVDTYGLSHETLGKEIGKKRSTISNFLRLLKLPPMIQVGLRDRQLTMGHARALINISSVEQQMMLFYRIVKEGLSVRKVEAIVKQLLKNSFTQPFHPLPKDTALQTLQNRLTGFFNTKVTISHPSKGKIAINFQSSEELTRIVNLLSPSNV